MTRHGGFSIALTQDIYAGYHADYYKHLVKTAGAEFVAKWGLREDQALAGVLAVPERPHVPIKIAGYQHFLSNADTLPSDKQFKLDGEDPLRSPESLKRLRSLMACLAKRMCTAPVWEGGASNGENPDVPAGYTYLLQLVAHDLMQTSFPLSILEDTTTGVRNDRSYQLKLDTIYGAGPEVCPFAYAIGPEPSRTRSRLRLSERVNHEDAIKMDPSGRDIPRFDAGEGKGPKPNLADVSIADPRNDDHAILSQLTALFHHLHNGLMSRLPQPSERETADSDSEATFDAFLCARGAATLIYRNIIRCDLLKRVLNREIYDRYNAERPVFLSDFGAGPNDGRNAKSPAPHSQHRKSRVPLEFTHGAFRFGHAMARDKYKINPMRDHFELKEALRATSSQQPLEMPLGRKWIVRWSNFFDVENEEGIHPQSSIRIGPHLSAQLEDTHLFPAIDDTGQCGLTYRDLMSAAFVGLWSVNALIEEIRARQPELIESCRLLNDRPYRVQRLRAWLEQDRCGMTDADVETLANDPPLPFFILFEAATGPDDPTKQGKTLGVLGSIIVAEVVFGVLREDRLPGAGLKQSLSHFCLRVYPTNHLDFVPEIETMGALVAFIAQIAKLEQADPAFL